MTGGSHYDTLGLPPDATPAEIREAFAERASRCPDRRASYRQRREAREAVAALKAAYETLVDPRRRADYDWRLGIDDLQPLDWGGARPEPHPPEALPLAHRAQPLYPRLVPRAWLFALKRRR
jgi:DnaJ-class molecular chaperone